MFRVKRSRRLLAVQRTSSGRHGAGSQGSSHTAGSSGGAWYVSRMVQWGGCVGRESATPHAHNASACLRQYCRMRSSARMRSGMDEKQREARSWREISSPQASAGSGPSGSRVEVVCRPWLPACAAPFLPVVPAIGSRAEEGRASPASSSARHVCLVTRLPAHLSSREGGRYGDAEARLHAASRMTPTSGSVGSR